MPKVSIIMLACNSQFHLDKSIQSILNQTYKDFEFIIIDQGSTDDSLSIIAKYQKEHPDRIQLISQQNYGTSVALNLGIDKSNCPYIMFVDRNDYLQEEILALMMEEAKETDADLVLTNARIIEDQEQKHVQVRFSGKMKARVESIYENKDLLNTILPFFWGKLYKKTLFTDNHIYFPLGLRDQDLGTIPRLLLHGNKIAKVNRALCHYNYYQDDDIKKHNYKILETVKNLRIVKNYYQEQKQDEEFADQLEYLFIYHLLFRSVEKVNKIPDAGIRSDLLEELHQAIKREYPEWVNNPMIKDLPLRKRMYLKFVDVKSGGKVVRW